MRLIGGSAPGRPIDRAVITLTAASPGQHGQRLGILSWPLLAPPPPLSPPSLCPPLPNSDNEDWPGPDIQLNPSHFYRYLHTSVISFLWSDFLSIVLIFTLVLTVSPGESYRRRCGSLLLYLYYVIRALINSLIQFRHTQNVLNES